MASDYLLEIDGIKGESGDATYQNSIEVNSFSWGVSQGGSFARGGGGGVARADFNDISFTKEACKAGPVLMVSAATGKHIAKAVLHVRKAGEDPQEYYKITFSDVLISSYQSGGSTGGTSLPMDTFSLNFAKIEYSYKEQKADGTLGPEVKTGFDLKKNTKV